jgi:hypothetical protein
METAPDQEQEDQELITYINRVLTLENSAIHALEH